MKRNFIGYGNLEYLDPEEFWSGPWRPVCQMMDTYDNEEYDIVTDGHEYRYTNI